MIDSCCLASSTCIFLHRLHNTSNCWVCGAMPLSVMDGLPWWVSPLHQEDFKSLCSFLGRQKETLLSLVNHNLSLPSWCKPDLQSVDSWGYILCKHQFHKSNRSSNSNENGFGLAHRCSRRDLCYIVKVECCVYIPDLSSNVSDALDDMKKKKKQVRAM